MVLWLDVRRGEGRLVGIVEYNDGKVYCHKQSQHHTTIGELCVCVCVCVCVCGLLIDPLTLYIYYSYVDCRPFI